MRFSTAEVLDAAGVDRRAVAMAIPGVDPSRVPVWAAARCFGVLWRRDVGAVALPWGIYLRRDLVAQPLERLAPLIIHELAHMEQWRRLGARRLLASYLGDYLQGRRSGLSHSQSYFVIGLEREARAAAGRLDGFRRQGEI